MNTLVNNGVKVSMSAALAVIITTVIAAAVARSSTGFPYASAKNEVVARITLAAADLMAPTA